MITKPMGARLCLLSLLLLLLLLSVTPGCLGPPEVTLANWPDGYKSAVYVIFETEHANASQIKDVADVIKAEGANATFFVVAGYYDGYAGDLEPLREFEVGNMGFYQADWKDREMTEDFQIEQIKRADEWLRGEGFDPTGFRAPYLKADEATYRVLEDLGYEYDSSQSFGFSPYWIGDIVEVPASLNFDLYWDERSIAYSTAPAYVLLQQSYEKDAMFAFYAHLETTGKHLQNLSKFLSFARSRGVWFATGREIADWWTLREGLELEVDGNTVRVKNTGKRPVDGAAIRVKPKKSVLGAARIVVVDDTAYAVLPRIGPGEEVEIYL